MMINNREIEENHYINGIASFKLYNSIQVLMSFTRRSRTHQMYTSQSNCWDWSLYNLEDDWMSIEKTTKQIQEIYFICVE